jgi:CRISPR/Cas system CSM-associated protein Csm2 small subunit
MNLEFIKNVETVKMEKSRDSLVQELSKSNWLEQQSKNEFEYKIGKMIGLENAAIKTLKTIASFNKKEQKTNLKKGIELKVHSKFNKIKTKKLSKIFDNIGNCEIDKSRVEEIAMETEKMALATINYYLLNPDIKEQDCAAYKTSKFLCLSQSGNSIEHTCCYFY